MIGDHIELVILDMEGDAIKIGINAPRSVGIYRKEIHMAIKQSNEEASLSTMQPELLKQLLSNNSVIKRK